MPQPIYPKLFRDILSYLERCEHEMIQDTCSLANRLVDNDFPEKPCHVWDSLDFQFKDNQINLCLRDSSKVWNPVSRTWDANEEQDIIRNGHFGHYPLKQMMPYIGKKARVKTTQIKLWNGKFAQQDMEVFELLAHIWEGQFVTIVSLTKISFAFSKSNKPCKFKLYIIASKYQHNLTEFLDANETSHEMLQLTTVPKSAAKNIFEKLTNIHGSTFLLYLLERKKA